MKKIILMLLTFSSLQVIGAADFQKALGALIALGKKPVHGAAAVRVESPNTAMAIDNEAMLHKVSIQDQLIANAKQEVVDLGKKVPTNDTYKQINFLDKVWRSFTYGCQNADARRDWNIQFVPRYPVPGESVSPISIGASELLSPERIKGRGVHAPIPEGNWGRGEEKIPKSSTASPGKDAKNWRTVPDSFEKCKGDRKKIEAKLARKAAYDALPQLEKLNQAEKKKARKAIKFAVLK